MEKSTEERKTEALQSIIHRQEARQAAIGERKQQRLEDADPGESARAFFVQFKEKSQQILTSLESSKMQDRAALAHHFDRLAREIRLLDQYLTDSIRFLPTYDVQTSQQQIRRLETILTETQDDILPKKKFAFKSRKQKPNGQKQVQAPVDLAVSTKAEMGSNTSLLDSFKLVVTRKSDATIKLTAPEVSGKDVEISSLRNCTVEIAGQPNALHMRDLKSCKVCIGPVSRSLLLHECTGCEFHIACQQLRIHTSTATDFHIHVTSKAIIEDCRDLRFAKYAWTYDGIEEDYRVSGLRRDVNNWDKVDDFNWLNPTEASPNWSIMPPGAQQHRILPQSE
eukprot:m.248031 g.248031  ORF g.248031 m.248031 type:complete len:338 (+) comp19501_c0_seq18:188-1201(+)